MTISGRFRNKKPISTLGNHLIMVLSLMLIFTSNASGGCKDRSLERASDVLLFARCSSQRPSAMNTNSMGGVSKNVIGLIGGPCMMAISKTTN